MRQTVIALSTMLVVSGCAQMKSPSPPICDGKHRRPVNLYGSVLNASSPAADATPSAAAPPPQPTPQKLSAIRPYFVGCSS